MSAAPANSRLWRRILLGSAAGILTLFVAALALVLWIVNTSAGTHWALRMAGNALGGALEIGAIQGSFAGRLTLKQLRYDDPAGSMQFFAEQFVIDVKTSQLLRARLRIDELDLRGVKVMLGAPQEPPPSQPFSLEPPLDIQLKRLTLADVSVQRAGETLVQIDTASASADWTGTGIDLRKLDMTSPQGEVHLQGALAGHDAYVGEGHGRFRWQVGTRTYAGTLQAEALNRLVRLNASMTSPLRAQLQLDLQQHESVPWTLKLAVPKFDPADELLPGSSLRSLAASLQGSGDLKQATLGGRVTINGEPLQLERIHVARQEGGVVLDALLRPPQGSIRANGTLALAQVPVSARLELNWQEVVIPAAWAGQVLHSAGKLQLDGSTATYTATGALQLGPPQRLANITLDAQGSPRRVQLDKFDLVQKSGELHATGTIDLQPAIGWQLQARASHFDPGEFAAGWPGDLNFALASQGRMSEQGAAADLQLERLNGRLRGRRIQGEADLHLSPQGVLAGTMDVRSGDSRVRVRGERGEAMNAVATLEVPSLDDWLPDTGGELRGTVSASGRWPDLKIDGKLRGKSLRVAAMQAESLALAFDVAQPRQPRGTLTLDGRQVAAGGFAFDTVHVRAQGDARRHTLQLDTTGQPLAVQLQLHGAYIAHAGLPAWAGTIDRLVLDVRDAARLQLQAPVDVKYAQQAASIEHACLADGDIRLCVEASSEASGVLQARYSLHDVPLALANTFAPSLPVTFSGQLDGDGSVRRDAQGRLTGDATVRSSQGGIARRLEGAAEKPEMLLEYADLKLVARLDGSTGGGNIEARLNDTGRLRGELAVTGLGAAAPNLRGTLSAHLPSIGVVELFAPQLADVHGQADLDASIAGTTDAPLIDGKFIASDLATDIPALGLKLRNGRLSVTAQPGKDFALAGNIASGSGELRFQGSAGSTGNAHVDVQGQRFLAADIPGASVIVEPKLQVERRDGELSLQGAVHIPSARINLQKLPRTQATQNLSADVVVIDAKTQDEAQREAMPLRAAVQVTLGEDVELAGFGLDAKVAGQLLVREAPGAPTTGSGEVRVAGTYQAYGQDLTIRQGQLLFAGTPLDNPRLSIVAVREAGSVVAGLRVGGSARNPQLTVFSEPPMAQSNALAYLVAGKPLGEVGASEGDAVQSAARSLGTAAGGLLAKNIGSRLGVDEVGIKDSEAIGGAALTVGQYLSPRLYLSYGVGLFDPGEVVTLRYKLSSKVAIEALNGPRDSRAGVEYRVEK